MAHFFGTIRGNRGEESRLGSKESGIKAQVMSHDGVITVSLWHDRTTGKDSYAIEVAKHKSDGGEPLGTLVTGDLIDLIALAAKAKQTRRDHRQKLADFYDLAAKSLTEDCPAVDPGLMSVITYILTDAEQARAKQVGGIVNELA